jgi:hypothetical protein
MTTTTKTAQRQKARDRAGRYAAMRPCERCGVPGELWPEYERDGVTMTGRDVCWGCSQKPRGTRSARCAIAGTPECP